MRINPVKKKLVYHYSKIAPYGKILTITLDNGIKYHFRSKTADRTTIKEVWAREIYTKHGFEIKNGDTVVDLGGHIGTFSILAATKAVNGKVLVFEPMKDNFEVLNSNIKLNKLNNIVAENIAISNENGTRVFYLSDPAASKKVGYVTGGHSFFPSKERKDKIEVPTETLDSIIARHNIEQINYLKLDTEGAEFDILFSASKEAIGKIEKIAMELHPFQDNTKEKMLQFLEENKYQIIIDKYGESDYMVYARRNN